MTEPGNIPHLASLLRASARGGDSWDLLRVLTDEVGPRYPCTPGDVAAVSWAKEAMGKAGLVNVRAEPATATLWERGHEAGAIVSPRRHPVVLSALGGSIGTDDRPLEAPVIGFSSLDELDAAPDASVEGKIVYLHHVMLRRRDGTGYNAGSVARMYGPSRAAKKGAIGFLVRSIGTDSIRAAHTGALYYAKDIPHIPAAALSTPDGDFLHRALERGPVHFSLSLGCRPMPVGESFNVVGEIEGTDLASEIVLLGAHLDSWDLGTGALDDGAGCAIAMAAARLLRDLPVKPRRTVRIALFANEELGTGGGIAYAQSHADETARHVAAMEADQGDGKPWALRVPANRHDSSVTRALHSALEALDIELDTGGSRGGVDIGPLAAHGVPFVDLRQDATRYFDFHHTTNDVLENVSRTDLESATQAFSAAIWTLASTDESYRSPG